MQAGALRAWCFLGLACAALLGAGLLQKAFLAGHTPEEMVAEDLEPGEFAGTVLLGGFRAVAIDILWVRALNRYEEGDYFEVLSLYSAIAKLQPSSEPAWIQAAFVMAYDISSELPDADARYGWFRRGVLHLVRGCERNPFSGRLRNLLGDFLYLRGVMRDPEVGRLFAEDRELNPRGRPIDEAALSWYARAMGVPNHPRQAIYGAFRCIREILRSSAEAARSAHGGPARKAALARYERAATAGLCALAYVVHVFPEWMQEGNRFHDAFRLHRKDLAEMTGGQVAIGEVVFLGTSEKVGNGR